jgi:ABC-type glycerol-3-phosphate transport system substrate-binding protein
MYTAILLIVFTTLLLSGCSNNSETHDMYISDILFNSKRGDLVSLTITPDSEVYAASWENGIARYNSDGDLLEVYHNTEFIYGITYNDGLLYGFNSLNMNIMEYDLEKKSMRVVYAGIEADNIRSIEVSDGYIFLIVIPSFSDVIYEMTGDGFQSYNEQFLRIDISSGEMVELTDIKNPMVLYKNSSGQLYLYAYTNNQYVLYRYNPKNAKSEKISEMDDVGYIFYFAYEHDAFVFFSNGIKAKQMPNGIVYNVARVAPLTSAGCFSFYQGNFVFLQQYESVFTESGSHDCCEEDHNHPPLPTTSIQTIRLAQDYVFMVDSINLSNLQSNQGTLHISAAYHNQVISTEHMFEQSGIMAVYIDQPVSNWDEYQGFLTSIMAGDSSIDIYILHYNDETTQAMRNIGYYVPLTDSEPIQSYFNQCFDWVRDIATVPGGDIWMLPVQFEIPVLWYIPENFERFNLTFADVVSFDGYYSTVERLNRENGSYHHFLHTDFYDWVSQYEMTYCDYENGVVKIDTPVFFRLFERLWTGWHRYEGVGGNLPWHPVLQFFNQIDWDWGTFITDVPQPRYNTEHVVFKLEYLSRHFDGLQTGIADWRALPIPRVTSNVETNYMYCSIAIINPHSTNRDLAMAFLEAAAKDMVSAVDHPIFIYNNTSMYEGKYDMTLPVYMDLLDLFSNGSVIATGFLGKGEYNTIVEEFQAQRITLTEALSELQRKAEFWLNE